MLLAYAEAPVAPLLVSWECKELAFELVTALLAAGAVPRHCDFRALWRKANLGTREKRRGACGVE